VPNADLISGNLVNWTLTDARRRVDIPIGTAYRHDPSEVKAILEGAIRHQPGVLNDPPPEVLVSGFGDSSIDFNIRVWTGSYVEGVRIQSALAQRIYKVLEEHEIEIPFPQRDLHVRSLDPTVAQAIGGDEDAS
jgi:small-conductance mechanosensitive channel